MLIKKHNVRLGLMATLVLFLALFNSILCVNTVRINCGGNKDYKDSNGNVWLADKFFKSGKSINVGGQITGGDVALYSDGRNGGSRRTGLVYDIEEMDAGNYQCKLHFVETSPHANAVARRVFHIDINGNRVQTSLDIFKEVGQNKALVKTYPCAAANGKISISFTHFIGEPVISAIEVVKDEANPDVSPVPGPPPVFNKPAEGNPNPTLPVERALYRINCGSEVDYTDKRGKLWSKDQYYVNPTNVDRFDNKPWKTQDPRPYGIDGTYDQTILLTERWAPGDFSYVFPNVQRGKWLVRLYWAELYEGNFELFDLNYPEKGLKGIGTRVFSVNANGVVKLPKVDVFQSVGPYSQLKREFYVDVNFEGQIKLDFKKIVEAPMIMAIEIVHSADVVPEQLLPTGYKPGLAGLFYNYYDYRESPIMTMPDRGDFTRDVSYIEIMDYLNNVMAIGKYRTTPYEIQFAAKIQGYLRVPAAGTYKITLESNDGSQMWIWNRGKDQNPAFINNDGNHRNIQVPMDIKFDQPGFYPILIKYFQGHVLTCLRLYWMLPGENFGEYVPYRKVGHVITTEHFSYTDDMLVPVVTKVDPNNGPLAGGNTITLTGNGFVSPTNTYARFYHPSFPEPKYKQVQAQVIDVQTLKVVAPQGMGGMGSIQIVVLNAQGQVVSATNRSNYFFNM